MKRNKFWNLLLCSMLFLSSGLQAQFVDEFDGPQINGWFYFTGDGHVNMDFVQKDGYATIIVDARKDRDNVWWAVLKRDVTKFLDLSKFADPNYQLRVEARVRLHNAPRRLNMMVNTNRTTNFHIDLMEFDIADTNNWHVISMTTKNFDARPGDTVYVQLDVTDFGLGKYYVDVDYYRAEIVDIRKAGPDKGVQVPYHPPIPPVDTFSEHLPVKHDAVIHHQYPEINFNDWCAYESGTTTQILSTHAEQWIVLRWDFNAYQNMKVAGSGLLELTTYSIYRGGNYIQAYGKDFGEEFGKIRVIEILGGDENWKQDQVTFASLTRNKAYEEVFNSQMIIDVQVVERRGGKNYITISRPVMDRLLSGKTKGLLIRPLGAIDISFYASEDASGNGPMLHFNVKERSQRE